MPETGSKVYRRFGKRAWDVALTVAALPVALPLALGIAGVVRLGLGRPVLFRQQRPGRAGRPFTLLKFRTMRDADDRAGAPAPDEERLTGLGRLLRRSSLDELPELWNVLRGEMSLVGPRPLLMEYLPLYDDRQARRHEVRPGITGWAQIHGRNALSWEEKFRYDVEYVDGVSFVLDLKILIRTVAQVARGRGVAAGGHATMPRFQGNTDD